MKSFDAAAVIGALYSGILGRDADPKGGEAWVALMEAGDLSLEEVVRAFVESQEFQGRQSPPASTEARFTNDTSQYGETFELLKLWVNEHQQNGWVVDVGARGRERSNSYDLLKHFGWRGLLVEANPALMADIGREFAGLDVHLVNCAVSDYEGRAKLNLGVNDDISSLDVANTKAWGDLRGEVDVEVRKLEKILDEIDAPQDFDLLSLDIEGEDIKVFNSLLENSTYRPRWVIIEASHDFTVSSLYDLPFSKKVKTEYSIRGQTPANLILRRRNKLVEVNIAA